MTPRIDWLRVTVYAALLVGLCGLATLAGWLIERFIARYGPWIMAHADPIIAAVLTVWAGTMLRRRSATGRLTPCSSSASVSTPTGCLSRATG